MLQAVDSRFEEISRLSQRSVHALFTDVYSHCLCPREGPPPPPKAAHFCLKVEIVLHGLRCGHPRAQRSLGVPSQSQVDFCAERGALLRKAGPFEAHNLTLMQT